MSDYIQFLPFWVSFGVITGYFASKRGRNPLIWFGAGLFFTIFALAFLFILPLGENKKKTPDQKPLPPLAPSPRSEATMRMWFYLDKERKTNGPVDFSDLNKTYENNEISDKSFLWTEGMEGWKPLKDLPDLHKELVKS